MVWRYLALNPVTNTWIHTELPFRRETMRWDLSAGGQLTGSISPVVPELRDSSGAPLLGEWKTAIFAEQDGEIRWGGLLNKADFDGPTWKLECIGYAGYPYGMSFTGSFYTRIRVDPTQVFADMWNHLQTQTRGNLGVQVLRPNVCPVRIGLPAQKAAGTQEAKDAEPYTMNWWEARDLGQELASLAQETPFDFYETHAWSSPTANTIDHRITIGYPRIGRKRTDLAFVQGDNVFKPVVVTRDGTEYANELIVLGKGEGVSTVRATVPVDDGRLRRTFVYTDKSVATLARGRAVAWEQRLMRDLDPVISSVDVINHSNARIGSFSVGDDILIDADVAWLGRVQVWSRITSISLINDDRVTLAVQPSDTYSYGPTA